MVKVYLEYSGGMGLSLSGSVETEDLDAELRAEAEAVLDPARPTPPPQTANPNRTEVESCRLIVEDRELVADSADRDLRRVAAKLRKVLIRQKRG